MDVDAKKKKNLADMIREQGEEQEETIKKRHIMIWSKKKGTNERAEEGQKELRVLSGGGKLTELENHERCSLHLGGGKPGLEANKNEGGDN